jgi:hypothetical protein
VLIGFNILRLVTFGKGLSFPESLAVSFGIGIGFISLQMLLYHFLNIKFDILAMIIPWAVLPLLNNLLFQKNKAPFNNLSKPSQPKDTRFKIFNICLWIGIIFEISYAFFRALIKPIESYDAVAIYAIKSKIFFLAKSIPADYFGAFTNMFPHPDYPLNIPLFQSFIYIALNSLNDQLVKVIFPLYFLAVVVMLYYAIRRFAGHTYSLVFTFVLASIPQFNAYAANAYLDLPLAYYSFASAIFLFEWLRERKSFALLALSAVMAGLAGWTKNEGLLYCVVSVLSMLVFFMFNFEKMKWRYVIGMVLYAAIIFLILAPWMYIRTRYHLVNTDVGAISLNPLHILRQSHRLGPIFYEFQKQIFGPKKWNIFWIAVLAAFALNFKKSFTGTLRYITIFLVFTVSGYIFIYLISPIDINFFLQKTWSRFLVQFLPIAVYWLAIILKKDVKE